MTEGVRASELDAGLGWLNTDRPLTFAGALRGQVVVLDFWTYCCINCMHILPDLAYLEEKYADEPVMFIGVHSAKFTNEASSETIRAAILRYEIQHPVVIDDQMKLWRAYTVRSWPTLVVVDSTRHVVGSVAGEGNRDAIDASITQALKQGRAGGTLASEPLTVSKETSVRAASGLKFPGKVLADATSRRLFLADSNHNRIVVATLPDAAGRADLVQVVGTGRVGAQNGSAEQATFHHPQGLAVGQGMLYVADTENNLIRAIDLSSFEVTTVVGTGEMSNDRTGGGMGTVQGINWPWDLAIEGSTLYVAMAGTHQIWRVDLPVGFARAFAGTGRENLVDGPTESAALAQPSGICTAGGNLYFADSEVSAIRGVDMASEHVFTIVGEGLFSFGDVDGTHPQAKLQHPLGVEPWNTGLLVADTYNHRIKLVDPASHSVRTLLGTGQPGTDTPKGDLQLFDPGGLSVCGDDLYVADTNNHRVVKVNLETGAWGEVTLQGLSVPAATDERTPEAIVVDSVAIDAGRDIALSLDIELPDHAQLSPEAPWSIRVTAGEKVLAQRTGKSARMPLSLMVPASATNTHDVWQIEAALAYCTESGGLCVPASICWHLPIESGGNEDAVTVRGSIEATTAV